LIIFFNSTLFKHLKLVHPRNDTILAPMLLKAVITTPQQIDLFKMTVQTGSFAQKKKLSLVTKITIFTSHVHSLSKQVK
jgi:hypothetical protein